MFERPGRSFLEAVGLALQIMVFIGLLMGDFFLITWLETNGYEIWAYVTCAFSLFVFLVWALWREVF
ncbi:hypothetical protein ACPCXE_06425 [Bacillus velezensis]|uniref:hypothetical protein n=1 Tax=Bacillus velezensis TaxID=492670 RepID=UPI0013D8BAE4|nr:hypothetical protein [Bacillus velezensis]MEC2277234.1 hypothetical protein [Bacillus velezensis]MEC2312063.1 hypothetical protein [Bacillus velezensis]MED3700895.1 hypothetical protein [Bacillus velezensis]